ncbi:MAG: DUF294 nucleotidyltransferase-like domain-containing protein [Rhabdochlamydiaceae bacterium]|jgi:hypothetical protein
MASPVSSDFPPSFTAPPKSSLIQLIQEALTRGDIDSAHKNLCLQLADVQEKDLVAVYNAIFQILEHLGRTQFSELEERLVECPFLSQSFHLKEQQRQLALKLGDALMRIDTSFLHAVEYYTASRQIIEDNQKEGHQRMSLLLLQLCLRENVFKDQVTEALNHPETFGCLIKRLDDLGRTFCCSFSDVEIMKRFYEHVRDAFNALRVKKQTPYQDYLPQITTGLLSPSYNEGGTYPTARYREHLDAVRKQFIIHSDNPSIIRDFQGDITSAFRAFFKTLVDDLILLLGPPPCPYELRAMGSFRREEMCPFSDIELFVFLETKNDQTQAYFKRFIHFLDLQLTSLGEKNNTHSFSRSF